VDVPELLGSLVALRPLSEDHIAELVEAARDRSSYAYTTVPDGPGAMEEYVSGLIAAREKGETVPMTQICRRSESCVGVTRFLNIRVEPPSQGPYAVEIGGTWLAAAAQGTGINADAKLQLLRYAFETWRVDRVDLVTDARNVQSRHAICAIGATEEGVLRNWQPSRAPGEEGLLRDSAMHAIISSEWPAVCSLIERRLEQLTA
jgi:RimJ/RimL family protein N-acetyltransferase